ncbi:MAG: hypothetical protein IH991_14140 [Planctomycetes bacterium]|nr:hypothetical protein [Planctomycetota bacterium]
MSMILLTLLLNGPIAQTPTLDVDQFAKLHRQLKPPAEEGWSSIPWKTSLVQACVQAAREKKPLLMVCRAGHPLGCV